MWRVEGEHPLVKKVVTLTEWEWRVSKQVARWRISESAKAGLSEEKTQCGQRGSVEATRGDMVGAATECAVAKYLGIYWPMSVNSFGPPDLGDAIEVRGAEPGHHNLILRPGPDKKHGARVFVLATGWYPEFTIHGWEWGMDVMVPEFYDEKPPYGKKGPWWLYPQRELRPIDDIPKSTFSPFLWPTKG